MLLKLCLVAMAGVALLVPTSARVGAQADALRCTRAPIALSMSTPLTGPPRLPTPAVRAESYTVAGTDWRTFKIAAQRGPLLTVFVIQTTEAYEDAHELRFQQMVGSFRFQTALDTVLFGSTGASGAAPLLRASGQGDAHH